MAREQLVITAKDEVPYFEMVVTAGLKGGSKRGLEARFRSTV